MAEAAIDFTHPELEREVTAVSGHYVITKESRLAVDGREVLYLAGYAVVDTSCCGEGGCGFALVPGFVVEWKYRVQEAGLSVSKVEPIRDPRLQEELRRRIVEREMVTQVDFP